MSTVIERGKRVVNHDDLYTAVRVEDYWVEVLDWDGKYVGRMDGVTGGNISCSTDARVKSGGQLTVRSPQYSDKWGNILLQPWVRVNDSQWPLGVFLPSAPTASWSDTGAEYTIDIHDKLLILDQDALPRALSIPKGTNLAAWVVNRIKQAGQPNVNITPSKTTNYRAMTWDAGTELLTVINDILDYIGYFSLTCDGFGQYHSEPYKLPSQRPVKWQFGESEASLIHSSFEWSQDLTNVPNRIVYTTQSTGVPVGGELNETFMVAVAENRDRNSPFSFQNRGRWITRVKTDAEAANQKELEKMVARALENAEEPFAKVVVSNANMPLMLNDIVHFKAKGYDLDLSVRKWEVELTPGTLMTTSMRKVDRTKTTTWVPWEEWKARNAGK